MIYQFLNRKNYKFLFVIAYKDVYVYDWVIKILKE